MHWIDEEKSIVLKDKLFKEGLIFPIKTTKGDVLMFCPKCGSILRPKDKAGKKILYCSCGFTKNPDGETTAELRETMVIGKRVEVVENIETLPKIKAMCDKCNNKVAYYWTQQTRGADEPETRFFRCTKCNHTWREYS